MSIKRYINDKYILWVLRVILTCIAAWLLIVVIYKIYTFVQIDKLIQLELSQIPENF